MAVDRRYDGLPFSWNKPQTRDNDQRWLEGIIRNAAPFSDGWTKTRIIQLAYADSKNATTYPGKTTEAAIVVALHQELDDYCLLWNADKSTYQGFQQSVDAAFVIETLNAWKEQQFTQAISRNFEVYTSTQPNADNVFLVTSTAPVSIAVDRTLPNPRSFRPLFNVNELAHIIHDRDLQRLTLRTHGYATPADSFFNSFVQEAHVLRQPDNQNRALPADHLYVGYQWASEKPITSPGLWQDARRNPGILFKFLLTLSGIAGIVGTLLFLIVKYFVVPVLRGLGSIPVISQIWKAVHFQETTHLALQWYWLVPTVFMLWLLVFMLLRGVVYQRDRYRAIHYGAPDLAEFFWRLDTALENKKNLSAIEERDRNRRLTVNLIGHSMGALLMVNVLRNLNDRFGKDDQGTLIPDSEIAPQADESDDIGKHLQLDKLILTSPDIPMEFLREGRNNYVRSAMRRCRRIYLMSSDRDVVLRYLSNIGNWFTEPSMEMSGLRLGNVYLRSVLSGDDTPPYLPFIRIMIHAEAAVQPTSSYELFQKFNYLDCSEMVSGGKNQAGLNGVPWKLNRLTALPIDFANLTLFLLGVNHLDVHGGYFQTQTRSFAILKFLLTDHFLADEVVKQEIETLIQDSQIRFLPSIPWKMPKSSEVINATDPNAVKE